MRSKLCTTMFKRATLALVTAAVAMSWSQTGRAQAPCLIERGQDPLDVLNSGVRHNVWITLDASGSMGQGFAGQGPKMTVAKDVLNQLMDELVDAAGEPLVNWAFSYYDNNSRDPNIDCTAPDDVNPAPPLNDADNFPDEPSGCVGLQDGAFVQPSECGGDSRQDVRDTLAQVSAGGFTPIGVGFQDLANYMVARHPDNTSVNFVNTLLPNQKNFIIHVTDGQDTCECNDYGYDIPTFDPDSDGIPNVPLRANQQNPNVTANSEAGGARQAYNAGLKGYEALQLIDPVLDGSQGNIFVIGMDLDANDKALINTIAWMASGAHQGRAATLTNPAFFADDPQALVDAFRNILAKIGVPQSTVSLGSPTLGSIREVIPSHTNTFVTPDKHIGDVIAPPDADDIDEARRTRANHQNNVLLTTSVEIPNFKGHFTATNIYTVTDNANPRTARVADFTEIWDAGDLLQQRSPDSRTILYNPKGASPPTLVPFDNSVPASELGVGPGFLSSIDGQGALTAADAVQMVVGVIRGYRLSIDPLTGTLYRMDGSLNFSEFEADGTTRTWKLYDTTAAPAIVQSPPRSVDFDPPQNHSDKYGVGGTQVGDGFYWDHFNRETMAYLPTNGGMMHAFSAETGEEVYAYIPGDVMGLEAGEVPGSRDTLADFVALLVAQNNGIINHKFFLSGAPIVDDVFLRSDDSVGNGDDEWHTVLAFGRGRGGRFVTGLDITNPTNPVLLFNRGNREGMSDGDYDGLGETWSNPVMGNVQTDTSLANPDRVDQWLMFFGGGYGCDNANNEGQYFFAIRVEDGEIYYRSPQITEDPTAPISHNVIVAIPTLYNPHELDVADQKDYVTRAYVGDVQGKIWKLVTTDIDPNNWTFNVFAELGADQPITAGVNLLKDTNNQQVWVFAGTGGDLRVDSALTNFKFAAFTDADAEGANTFQYAAGASVWERQLGPDFRVFIPPVTIGEIGDAVPPLVFFAASRPEFNTQSCVTQFFSSLFALGVLSGQAEVDLDGGGNDDEIDLGEGKVTGLYARDGNLYVSESGGLGTSGGLTVYGDGDFDDEPPSSGGDFSIQVLVDGFRVSPF